MTISEWNFDFGNRLSAGLGGMPGESAAKYLNELKETGGGIIPKKWQAEISRLTAQKNVLYEKMKAMCEELKTVETLRKNAEQLAKEEQQPRKEQKHER